MTTPFIHRRTLLQSLLLSAMAGMPQWSHANSPPALQRPTAYHSGIALEGYWVSEKLDGVRGYWDGTQLWTRGGQRISAPAWFTAGWPREALDGELWAGHAAFATAVSTVRQGDAGDAAWRQMRYQVFDLPAHAGPFDARLVALQQLGLPAWVQPVAQSRVVSHPALQALLRQTVQAGGEGLVLHRGDALLASPGKGDLLKLKPFDDAEARVVGHVAGKGKYEGMLGALQVETPEGLKFKLGTGFSDAQRRDPPALGTWVSYRFRDVNPSGIPRFASFLRLRADADL
ncbi:DNA ligase [Rhodoferax sp.]|uniref:DNA ligase n=1 Tax=Rhodoferax sp. TaxID=50421 RepID=UPI0025D13BEC|nr:DNA ligase [Rhodoferax sp.]